MNEKLHAQYRLTGFSNSHRPVAFKIEDQTKGSVWNANMSKSQFTFNNTQAPIPTPDITQL